jgi:predicted RecB family nuclease
VQGAFRLNGWVGRTDILRRVEAPSALGAWSYEVIDTKLARETKDGTVLQLCLYSDLVASVQGTRPTFGCVVAPWSDFVPQAYRIDDYLAYCRRVQSGLEAAIGERGTTEIYLATCTLSIAAGCVTPWASSQSKNSIAARA